MKMILLATSLVLFVLGLAILVLDAWTVLQYGFHGNEVAGITPDGDPIDWPTGERPVVIWIPLYVYGLGFWLVAGTLLLLRREVRKPYCGRIRRGTE